MKVTLQLPEDIGRELVRQPDFEVFACLALMKALEERRQSAERSPDSRRNRRRLDATEERAGDLPKQKSRNREDAWRRSNREYLQGSFAGQWVVLEGEEIVANSEDAAEAVREARAKGVAVPFVFFVEPPRPPGVVQIGL